MMNIHPQLTVRRMTPADLDPVVDVHIRAFPGFFLSFLGPRFLREFYRSFTCDVQGVAFVAEQTDTKRLLGVVAGPVVPNGYFRRLLVRRWWAFCLASVSAVLRNPRIVPRLWRAVFYRGEPAVGMPRALLSSLAVAPDAQRQGIGLLLVNAWVDEVKTRGAPGCYLTTDTENNEFVNRFYERVGWRRSDTFVTPEGRRMNRYVLDWEEGGRGQ